MDPWSWVHLREGRPSQCPYSRLQTKTALFLRRGRPPAKPGIAVFCTDLSPHTLGSPRAGPRLGVFGIDLSPPTLESLRANPGIGTSGAAFSSAAPGSPPAGPEAVFLSSDLLLWPKKLSLGLNDLGGPWASGG